MTRQGVGIAAVAVAMLAAIVGILIFLPEDSPPQPSGPAMLVQYIDCSPSMADVLPTLRDEVYGIRIERRHPRLEHAGRRVLGKHGARG